MKTNTIILLSICVFALLVHLRSETAVAQELIFHAEAWEPDHLYLGQAVCGLGDQNGDGFDDIAISVGFTAYPKSILIYHGGSPMDSIYDFEITFLGAYSFVPTSMKNVRDLDGDGLAELGVLAYPQTNNGNNIFIYHIGAQPDTVPGWVINSTEPYYYNGFQRISPVGDFNNDGFSDLLVSQPLFNDTQGRVSVYYGSVQMDTLPDWIVEGDSSGCRLGYSLSGGGDLNGDGFDDIAVKEGYYPPDNLYIFFGGSDPDTLPDLTIPQSAGFAIVEDLNGDDFDDLVVGDEENHTLVSVYFGGSPMDTEPDLVLEFPPWAQGARISTTGDCTGDDYGDIIIGDPVSLIGGDVYVFFGSWDMDGEYDVHFSAYTTIGGVVGKSGDVNGDGVDDIMWGSTIPFGYVNIYAGDSSWAVSVIERPEETPSYFALFEAFPNPFNDETNIAFELPESGEVVLAVYDLQGREVVRLVEEFRPAGFYREKFRPIGLASGIYFARMMLDGQSFMKKLVLLK